MLGRLLREENILLDPEEPPLPEGVEPGSPRAHRIRKEWLLDVLVTLLESTGKIGNATKLLTDLLNRERKASTVLGRGVAFPHVRTMQARAVTAAAVVSRPGLDLEAPDGAPVHLVLALVSPPYEDQAYLRLYKRLGELLGSDHLILSLRAVREPGEVVRLLGAL
ncbi:MAG: PTS sugar transporter subunit IIA [Planctomycetales bacterium]|nr:PTS sugar transporter subunit IIA [Planctomycetales bacterium]